MMKTCDCCGKVLKDGEFTLKDYATYPWIRIMDKKHFFCSKECLGEFKEIFVREIYKDKPIYFINGYYMPYLECPYGYKNIEDCKKRMDLVGVGVYLGNLSNTGN